MRVQVQVAPEQGHEGPATKVWVECSEGEQVLRWLAFFSCSLLAYEVGDNPTVRTRAPWGDPPLGILPFLPSPSFSRMPAPG